MINTVFTIKYSIINNVKLSLKRNIENVYFIFIDDEMIFNTLDRIKAEEYFQFYKSGLNKNL